MEDHAELRGHGVQRYQRVEETKQHEEHGLVRNAAHYRQSPKLLRHGGQRKVTRVLLLGEGKSAAVALLLHFEEMLGGRAFLRSSDEHTDDAVDEREARRERFAGVLDERNLLPDQQKQTIFNIVRKSKIVV